MRFPYENYPATVFQSSNPAGTHATALVIACSDGRLQPSVDEFLHRHVGLTHYDRLYAPGGPGALASSGVEFLRGSSFQRECLFLVEAHQIQDVYLIFHGPAPDGPAEAVCGDYRRLFPRLDADGLRAQQLRDLQEIISAGFGVGRQVQVHAFLCEVGPGNVTRFVPLPTGRSG